MIAFLQLADYSRQGLILIIRFYQRSLSLLIGERCRFHPSCSNFAIDALSHHGVVKGGWMTVKRVLRCNPWNPGGVDFVKPQSLKPNDDV